MLGKLILVIVRYGMRSETGLKQIRCIRDLSIIDGGLFGYFFIGNLRSFRTEIRYQVFQRSTRNGVF